MVQSGAFLLWHVADFNSGPEARPNVSGHRHAQRLSLSGAHDGTLLSGTHPDLTRHGGGHCDDGLRRSDVCVQGVGWVFLNSAIAVADRLLQRLLLSKDQKPVDISKSGITFINNAIGMIPVGLAAYWKGEVQQLPVVFATLSSWDQVYILLTCHIGLSICYTGIWAQFLGDG